MKTQTKKKQKPLAIYEVNTSEIATKDFVRQEIHGVRQEIHGVRQENTSCKDRRKSFMAYYVRRLCFTHKHYDIFTQRHKIRHARYKVRHARYGKQAKNRHTGYGEQAKNRHAGYGKQIDKSY